jgi:hypothetical protein
MSNKLYAVLTGDLVKSSKLTSDESQNAMQWLREAADKIVDLYPESIAGTIDTFRHDSWQLLLTQPSLCLRVAVFFRTALKLHSDKTAKYDTRISIGIGEVEFIAESRVSDSRGPAFTISGKNLDDMGRNRLVCQAQNRDWVAIALLSRVAVPLLDCVVSDWTSTEAHAVHGTLKGLTQEEIAQSLPPNPRTGKAVTRQAVSDSLERGHWGNVEETLRVMGEDGKLWGLQ